MNRWVGRVAVVTGASSGMGKAIAVALVGYGMEVVALARREDRLLELKQELAGEKGKLHPLKMDLAKEEDILAAFAWIEKNLGAVHVLVNNAGMLTRKEFQEYDTKEWIQMLDVNVLGPSITIRETINSMKKYDVDFGHIINISSVAGTTSPLPTSLFYAAAKRSLNAISEGLRNEFASLGTKIKVTNLSPGLVDTEFHPSKIPDHLPRLQAKDIADGVVYCLSTPPHLVVTEITLEPLMESIYELAALRKNKKV